jgi:hypothetical protein
MQVGKANSCIKVYSFLVPDLLLKFNHTTFSKSTKEPCYIIPSLGVNVVVGTL